MISAVRRRLKLSAIACPEAFEQSAVSLGAEVAWHVRCRDHHRFTVAEVEKVASRAGRDGVRLRSDGRRARRVRLPGGQLPLIG